MVGLFREAFPDWRAQRVRDPPQRGCTGRARPATIATAKLLIEDLFEIDGADINRAGDRMRTL